MVAGVAVNVPIAASGSQRTMKSSFSLRTGVVDMTARPERWECRNVVDEMGGLRKKRSEA